jgi:hypothetical protein
MDAICKLQHSIPVTRDSSTEVEHSPHHPKVKGLCLTTAAGTGRENIVKNVYPRFCPSLILVRTIKLFQSRLVISATGTL